MNKPSGLAKFAAAFALLALSGCSKRSEQASTPASPAQLYTLNLSPAFKVGQKFSLVADLTEKSRSHAAIVIPGIAAPQNDDRGENIVGHIEGDAQVLGVFPNGGIQKISIAVGALKVAKDGVSVPNLPVAGALIVLAREGDKIAISVDDKAADAGVAAALNELVSLDDEKFVLQDLVGPKTPVPVGGTWPVNSTAVENSIKDSLGGEVKDAQGTMKLESVKGSGADEVFMVSGSYTVGSYKPALPSTMTIDAGLISTSLACSIPTTTTKGTLKLMRSMTMKTQAHGSPNGGSVKLDISGEQNHNTVMTFK